MFKKLISKISLGAVITTLNVVGGAAGIAASLLTTKKVKQDNAEEIAKLWAEHLANNK